MFRAALEEAGEAVAVGEIDGFESSQILRSHADDLLAVGATGESSCARGINGDQQDNSCEAAGAVYVYRTGP